MTLHMVACLPCVGTGIGDGTLRSPRGGALYGVCRECRGTGEVTEAHRERQERAASSRR